MIEYLKDRYLTWRTGYTKADRLYLKWREETIAYRATTIENMFMNFEYILHVSVDIFNHAEPFGWVPSEDFQQYMYPNRDLDNCAVYHFARGTKDQWDGKFHLDGCFGEQDQVFVATNNKRDAVMIALKYS